MSATPVTSNFYYIVENYWDSIRAYREFLNIISSAVTEVDERRPNTLKRAVETATQGMSSDDRRTITAILKSVTDGENAPEPGATPPPEMDKLSGEGLTAFVRIIKAVKEHAISGGHQHLLHQGVLTGLVGQFEVLLADVAHAFYSRAPAAIESDDKVLSVGELRAFTTIEEAIDFIIEKRIDDLLRGSADDWRKFFVSRIKIDIAEVAEPWGYFVEYIQRRHLLVHAGGRISRRYLSLVAPEIVAEYLGKEAKIGDRVPLPAEYIQSALSAFESVGLIFGLSSWMKLYPQERDGASSVLLDIVYDQLLISNWPTVARLSRWGTEQSVFSEATRMTCRMNFFLANRHSSRWGEMRKELVEMDTTALHPKFAAVRAALLDDVDEFARILESTNGAELDQSAWEEWPAFQSIREDPKFVALKRRFTRGRRTQRKTATKTRGKATDEADHSTP